MIKYLSKIFIIICLLEIISLNLLIVNAEPTIEEENLSSDTATEVLNETITNEDISEDSDIPEDTETTDESNESDEDIYTEETEKPIGQVQPSSTDSMDITSVKNINGLPEANLELNNILNIILIAIGVLLILLSIALLIRLKK